MSRFIVMDRAAQMPSTVRSPYRRVAVVETTLPEGQEPKMISARAKGVVRIVRTWERQYVGETERCAFQRALAEAYELAESL